MAKRAGSYKEFDNTPRKRAKKTKGNDVDEDCNGIPASRRTNLEYVDTKDRQEERNDQEDRGSSEEESNLENVEVTSELTCEAASSQHSTSENLSDSQEDQLGESEAENLEVFDNRDGVTGSEEDQKEMKATDSEGGKEMFAIAPVATHLPLVALEVIFSMLPMSDLVSCRLACQRWNQVISREKFLYWKTTYYQLKSGRVPNLDIHIYHLAKRNGMAASLECLVYLTKYVARLFEQQVIEGPVEKSSLWTGLQLHPQFSNAMRAGQLHPELILEEPQCSLSALVVLLVLMSEDVYQVRLVFLEMTVSPGGLCPAPYSLPVATELFYCMATLLYHLWREDVLPQRYHYQVFYVLHIAEQGASSTDGSVMAKQPVTVYSQSSPWKRKRRYQLTQEQMRVINHPIQPRDVVKVVAFAGTGKTTTLLHLAALNPSIQFLYLVFNKSVQIHANDVFPKTNVRCQTFHSLAWSMVKNEYRYGKIGTISLFAITQLIEESKGYGMLYTLCKYIYSTIENFTCSSDPKMTSMHVRLNHGDFKSGIPQNYEKKVLKEAKKLWERMCDPKDYRVKISHDGYLKVCQLRKLITCSCDCILVDEAQDLTPTIISILEDQPVPKVFVGDPHQQIYSFRGATNALENINFSHSYYLKQSFRFGPHLGYITSCMLDVMKGVHRQTIVGGLQEGGFTGTKQKRKKGQLVIIARTNAELFDQMVEVTQLHPRAQLGFAGGIQGYDFDMLLDMNRLMMEKEVTKITHPFVRRFHSFKVLEEVAKQIDDVGLLGKIMVCHKYKNTLPKHISVIRSRAVVSLVLADFVFSTAHKSKGLEFDCVAICDDFLSGVDLSSIHALRESVGKRVDEYNLLYVAVTRARHQVIMSETLHQLLLLAGEHHFYQPSLSEVQVEQPCPVVEGEGVLLQCVVCKLNQSRKKTPICRRPLVVGIGRNSQQITGGMVCSQCVKRFAPHLSSLAGSVFTGLDTVV